MRLPIGIRWQLIACPIMICWELHFHQFMQIGLGSLQIFIRCHFAHTPNIFSHNTF